MFEKKYAVSQRPTVVEEGDNVNHNSPEIYAKDEPSLN